MFSFQREMMQKTTFLQQKNYLTCRVDAPGSSRMETGVNISCGRLWLSAVTFGSACCPPPDLRQVSTDGHWLTNW